MLFFRLLNHGALVVLAAGSDSDLFVGVEGAQSVDAAARVEPFSIPKERGRDIVR